MPNTQVWYSIDDEKPPEERLVARTKRPVKKHPEAAAQDAVVDYFWLTGTTPEECVVFLYESQDGDLIGKFDAMPETEVKVAWYISREEKSE